MRFHEPFAPSREALERIVHRVRDRTLRWLRKKGLLEERLPEERSNEAPETSALEACATIALRGGTFARVGHADAAQTRNAGEARFEPKRRGPMTAEVDGFNVQAAVRIEADEDEGRERLVRYCARHCFALERLSILPGGRVAYRVKYAGRGGTHRIMTSVEFLARLAALVAPPRYPLVRYHGVLAPHSKWRSVVVPKPPPRARSHDDRAPPPHDSGLKGHAAASALSRVSPRRPPNESPKLPAAPPAALPPPTLLHATSIPNGAVTSARVAVEITDFGISVRHIDRLLGGLLLTTSPRIDWAKLLRRTYATDVLACASCGGRLRLLSAITEKATAKKILEHLGLPAEPPERRARDPAAEDAG